MSKVAKLRSQLASMQREREDFELQRRALEAQMSAGRKTMDKIQKGLKNNVIINDPAILEVPAEVSAVSKRLSRKDIKSFINNGAANAASASASAGAGTQGLLSPVAAEGSGTFLQAQVIIPSGPRISDWCFTGPLDSAPPIVKSRALYENIRLLGRGAFGEVNLVKNAEDNKLFAVKSIFCSKDHDLEPVLREIRFLRACRHPCIIDVHDSFITTNPRVVQIVMHYCESGSLASVISSAKKTKTFIAEAQVLKWVAQLALALNFLHERKVLHRDIKPMNIMLTEGGDLVKVADFGLAMNIEESNEQPNLDEAGTPYYTAPEMIQRESYSSPADCWSFGVILYQLLALERPFDGASTADLVKAILTAEPAPLPAHYSEDIKNISKGLLDKNQYTRLSTRAILCEPIVFPKVANFPQVYRPKNLEERIRRTHLRLLEQQIDIVQRTRRASSLAQQPLMRPGLGSPSVIDHSLPSLSDGANSPSTPTRSLGGDKDPMTPTQESSEHSPKGGRVGQQIASAILRDRSIEPV